MCVCVCVCVPFRTNAQGESMNPLIPPAILISSLLFFNKDCLGIN